MNNCNLQNTHADVRPGLIMEGVKLEEKTNCDGESKYWVATSRIDSIFGSQVEGECRGVGRTKEQALERLRAEIGKLYESIWF